MHKNTPKTNGNAKIVNLQKHYSDYVPASNPCMAVH